MALMHFVDLVTSGASHIAVTVTPVTKVIDLLGGMLEKAEKEKTNEEVQFATYKMFCETTSAEKERSVKQAGDLILSLKADIEKNSAEAEQLTKEIAQHDTDIAVWMGDSKAATKVRDIEKAHYDTTHTDYSESIKALESAVAVLKDQPKKTPQKSFVQVAEELKELSLIPANAKRIIDAFVSAPEGLEVSAPEASGYEFQSAGIIDLLEKLLDEFAVERTALEKEELKRKHAYEMLKQDLTSQIDEATEDRNEKAERKAKKLQAKADAMGDLTDTTSTEKVDSVYLSDLVATCEEKATNFQARQELRSQEINAIEKATEIISSKAVSGAAEKHLPALVEIRVPSLAQLRADMEGATRERTTRFLELKAQVLGSHVLSTIAEHVSADPFNKIRKMIDDLITRLLEQANEEAEHKAWCDTELATNEKTRSTKTKAVETLTAEIDQLQASIAALTEDIEKLSKQVVELDAAMTEASDLRAKEKANNAETISDAAEAQTAVAQAVTVLKEFYAKAGEAVALAQQEPPKIFGGSYRGMQSENGGIVGMLKVIQSDFARLEADTKSEETSARKEYDTFMTDSKINKVSKGKDLEHKSSKKQDQSLTLTHRKQDLEGTQQELSAANSYFEKLKPNCVDAGANYDDKAARRKDEIESLQIALRILNGEDVA